ncbi:MAG TPA: FkbM family methyltransferase, partial [Longimicrobiaceae bacterium]
YRRLAERLGSLRTGARIHPVNAAVGSATGELEMNVYGDAAGTNSLVRRGEGLNLPPPAVERVRVVDGDTFCDEHGITELGFAKVDTEGFELEVMKGLKGMLSRSAVGVLQFEYGGTWSDARVFLRDAFELLEPLGYRIAKIHPTGVQLLSGYDPGLDSFRYANFLALRGDWVEVFSRAR